MIDYPPEIQNENQKAWYLRHFMGYSYRQIGEELKYSKSAVQRNFFPTLEKYERQSIAVIYRKQTEFCRDECGQSVSDCRQCNLYRFMVAKMLKRKVR